LFAINMLSSQVPWFAIPGGEAKKDLNGAKYLESCMGDMATPWPMVLSEILTMVTHGWSWMEKVYKLRKGPRSRDPRFKSQYSDGYVGWANWAPRAQTTLFSWDYKENSDELKGLIQMGPPDIKSTTSLDPRACISRLPPLRATRRALAFYARLTVHGISRTRLRTSRQWAWSETWQATRCFMFCRGCGPGPGGRELR